MDFQPNDTRPFHIRTALRRFQKVTSMKVDLALVEFGVAHEGIEAFLSDHL